MIHNPFLKLISHLRICIFLGFLFSQSTPEWIETMPVDDDYYWARENVGIRELSEEEYKSKAAAKALETISMQIRTTVSGVSTSNFKETETEFGSAYLSEFDQTSSSSTISDIQGAEKVDEYATNVTYWVLWKLKKSVHAENMEAFVQSALGQYEGFTYAPEDDPVQQLQYLIPAYEDVIKVAGVPVIYEGKNLKAEIPNQISAVLNSLKLVSSGETQLTGKAGFAMSSPLKVQIRSQKKNAIIRDIPILYEFESGEGEFSTDQVLTSESGKGSTKITKLISRKTVQQVRAKIDLKEWREDRLSKMISFENRLDEMSRANSVLFTIDVAQVTQEKIAVITVGDTSVYKEDDYKRLNRSFRSEFSDVTDFKLKDEALIEGIIEDYKRSASLCSNEECQVEIGKKLGVEKLIFVDIADYPKQTSVTIFLRNIAENELEQEYTYSFDHKSNEDKEKKINVILDNAPYMVEDFWLRTNPGFLTLKTRSRGVKGQFVFLDPTQWMDKKFEKRLPINSEKFYEGSYEITINKLGFEKYHQRFDVAMGEFPEFDIALKPKKAGKAALKSLVLPGRGQFYSSDIDNRGRRWMGLLYFTTSVASASLSGKLWSDFYDAKNNYTLAKTNYEESVEIQEIQDNQAIMTSKHAIMSDGRNTAVLVTGLFAGIWVANVLDAVLFFPKEYRSSRLSLHVEPQQFVGKTGAKTKLTWSF
jgi:hypothetical protein